MPKHTDRLVPVSPAAALPPLLERRVRTDVPLSGACRTLPRYRGAW